jgi:hypothetical protein
MERQLPMNEFVVFFDGCHEIYYAWIGDTKTIADMRERGWDDEDMIIPNFHQDVRYIMMECWDMSCPLRFVQPANLDDKLPTLRQFDEDFEVFFHQFYDYFTA